MPDSELYQWRESSSHSAGPSLNCARNGAIGSPLSDRDGFRTDVIAALRELSIPVVRWPGGCFASAYHWLDGVGNPRRPSFDKAWGVEDSNLFGTGEFVKWCRAIGAEPYFCRVGTPGAGVGQDDARRRQEHQSAGRCHHNGRLDRAPAERSRAVSGLHFHPRLLGPAVAGQ